MAAVTKATKKKPGRGRVEADKAPLSWTWTWTVLCRGRKERDKRCGGKERETGLDGRAEGREREAETRKSSRRSSTDSDWTFSSSSAKHALIHCRSRHIVLSVSTAQHSTAHQTAVYHGTGIICPSGTCICTSAHLHRHLRLALSDPATPLLSAAVPHDTTRRASIRSDLI